MSRPQNQGVQAAFDRWGVLEGDDKSAKLQRIYGRRSSQKDLDEYSPNWRKQEAIIASWGLDCSASRPGRTVIFYHPKGGIIRKLIEDWMRDRQKRGYSLVYAARRGRTMANRGTYYAENMFAGMELDDAEYRLKPMNCPGHILIYRDKLRSYRELPVRLGELGTVYRYERSGTMHGLLRVRGFTQDDAHIFCTPDQIENEVVNCLEFALDVLKVFGFEEYDAEISTWDGGASGKYDGEADQWALAEGALKRAVERLNIKAPVIPDEAAFYGPKIDVKLLDALGRKWQLSTVQFDFTLPKRFGLEYVHEDGKRHQPLMVHRALYGSIERFFGTLIEHYAGAFPVWLAPVQVVVMPITDRQQEYAQKVHAQLEVAGLRAHLDDRKEKVNLKIREAQLQKVPYMLVVGDREAEAGTVSVRHRKHADLGVKPVAQFIAEIENMIATKVATDWRSTG
jgi:threonyl-tRNA synthetase